MITSPLKSYPVDGDPFRVEGPAQINFSGGRSSGYLLHRILQAHGGTLPDDVVVLFCNTGKERPETLNFVQACSDRWGVPITWLEYRYHPERSGGRKDPKTTFAVVDHNSASRHGEPFEDLIACRRYIPNHIHRICTAELKVRTMRRYIRATRRWRRWRYVVGIRYDERRRWGRILAKECDAVMPMVWAETTQADVARFWREQPFDLGIDSRHSNCDLCFLKGTPLLLEALRAEPELADWWIAQEARVRAMGKHRNRPADLEATDAMFRRDHPYSELKALAARPADPGLFDDFSEADWDACNCTD